MTPHNRRRVQLILLLSVFAVPALLALALGQLGWQPGTRSFGEPILPQRSFTDIRIPLGGDTVWAWRDVEPRMTLIALPGPACAQACLRTLAMMRNARVTLNQHMDRLRLLYVGTPPPVAERIIHDWAIGSDPAGALAAFRPSQPDSVAAVLVESNGTALLHYPAGFDPSGLRKDLKKVIR
ncbi:MAG TPA: hypothetical protein VFN09_10075 [Rhodanobacteraceae bacterium]|nr:hypothetical protein [Rhodanobacteraceae bacterium]